MPEAPESTVVRLVRFLALGVPTLCLTPKYVAWRYGVAGPNPWYRGVEMLRQARDDDWSGPIAAAADRVVRLAGRREAA